MARQLATGEFLAKDLGAAKWSSVNKEIGQWVNAEGRDIRVGVAIQVGKTGGLLDATAANILFTPWLANDKGGTGIELPKKPDTYLEAWMYFGEFIIRAGETMFLYLSSDNVLDSDVDGDWYVYDLDTIYNTTQIGGAAPLTAANIQTECNDALVANDLHLIADASGEVVISNESEIVTAIFAATGITAGGTYTFAKITKIMAAMVTGQFRLKSGQTNIYEVLDVEDGSTVIAEITLASTTPFRTPTIL